MNTITGIPVFNHAEIQRRQVQANMHEQEAVKEQIAEEEFVVMCARRDKVKGVIRNSQKTIKNLKERLKTLRAVAGTLYNGGVY